MAPQRQLHSPGNLVCRGTQWFRPSFISNLGASFALLPYFVITLPVILIPRCRVSSSSIDTRRQHGIDNIYNVQPHDLA